jgi:hypothetical protein
MDRETLPPVLVIAVEKFVQWSNQQLQDEQAKTEITRPLYRYTNASGLALASYEPAPVSVDAIISVIRARKRLPVAPAAAALSADTLASGPVS